MIKRYAFLFALTLLIIVVFSSLNYPFLNFPLFAQTPQTAISAEGYDKLKNCTNDLSKKPTPVEYLTHFNCGHISKDETGKTVRQFTLIVDEGQKIPITYEGHIMVLFLDQP